MLLDYKQRSGLQPYFEMFKPSELHVLVSRLESAKGFPFEFELGSKMV
jgi:hypothetical protein